eukprot:11029463-Alexandrium_andersonii.AAC.1
MSASLVGSEMCIRDRKVSLRAPTGPGSFANLVRLAPECSRGPSRMVPVSYTHLTLPTICSV